MTFNFCPPLNAFKEGILIHSSGHPGKLTVQGMETTWGNRTTSDVQAATNLGV